MALDHDYFMSLAIEMARSTAAQGNRPIGSLVVDAGGNIVGKGANRVHTDCDPTAHGEMIAIREASRSLGSTDLTGCTLYSALEPCPMCCWAMLDAKISTLVLGGRHAGIRRTDVGTYSVEALLELTGRSIQLVTGIRSQECEAMRLAWNSERAAQGPAPA
jgi:tRNA(adenine34) deaminase